MSTGGRISYPAVRRDESSTEELHGVQVADPYRWLEDVDDAETIAFVTAQNNVSSPFLSSSSARNQYHARWVSCFIAGPQCMSCNCLVC